MGTGAKYSTEVPECAVGMVLKHGNSCGLEGAVTAGATALLAVLIGACSAPPVHPSAQSQGTATAGRDTVTIEPVATAAPAATPSSLAAQSRSGPRPCPADGPPVPTSCPPGTHKKTFEVQGGHGWRCELLGLGRPVQHGPEHKWWDNGEKRSEGILHRDKPIGIWRVYFTSGKLWERIDYQPKNVVLKRICNSYGHLEALKRYRDGKEDGLWTTFWYDGSKNAEGHYRRGLRVGLWQAWNQDGAIHYAGQYLDGKKHGKWTEQSGSHGKYDHGRRSGEWHEYDSAGYHWAKNFVAGKEHGRHTKSASDGTLQTEGSYQHGKMHGEWIWYRWPSHELAADSARGSYASGRKTGPWRWVRQGKRRLSGTYVADERHGPWTLWHPSGAIEARGIYRAGKLVGGKPIPDPFPPPLDP